MFMPGYQAKGNPTGKDYDWELQKAVLKNKAKRQDKARMRADAIAEESARAGTKDRFRQAKEAAERGASRAEIRLIMEA
jgi:hypothetical protein